MPWVAAGAAAAALVAMAASNEQNKAMRRGDSPPVKREKPLETLEREHRAAVKEQLAVIQREAKTGAYLLAALFLAIVAGVAHLAGVF